MFRLNRKYQRPTLVKPSAEAVVATPANVTPATTPATVVRRGRKPQIKKESADEEEFKLCTATELIVPNLEFMC